MMDEAGSKRGAAQFVRFLVDRGYRHVFGLPGSSMVAPLHELQRTDIAFVSAIHESVAVAAADGYARVAGSAMVMLYMLPGMANGLANIYNAWRDETPLFIVSSQQATRCRTGTATIGEGDLVAMMQPYTRAAHELGPGVDLRFWLDRAAEVATGPTPGPVFLSIPQDIFEECQKESAPAHRTMAKSGAPDLSQIVQLLRQAERPLIMVGGQLRRFGGSCAVEQLALDHGIALAYETGFPDRYGVAPGHPHCFGGISAAQPIEEEADLVIGIGTRLLLEAHPRGSWFKGARFVAQVNADPAKLAETLPADWTAACDPAAFAEALAKSLAATPPALELVTARRAWIGACRQRLKAKVHNPLMQSYHDAVAPLHDALERGWVVDESVMGIVPLGQTLSADDGRRYIGTSGASLGWGTGAAVGVALASGEPVTCVMGDGALRFGALGLWTIREQNLPITLVVIDNGGYGSTRFFERQYVGRLGAEASPPNAGYIGSDLRGSTGVRGIIEGFGIPVQTVPAGGDARAAIERAWATSTTGPNAVVIEMPFVE